MVLLFWNLSSNLFVNLDGLCGAATGCPNRLHENCLEEDKLPLRCVNVKLLGTLIARVTNISLAPSAPHIT